MKNVALAAVLALALSGCVTAAGAIAVAGALATAGTAGLADFCATSTDESARAKAGCAVIEE